MFSPVVGHTMQICILKGYLGHGVARMLMQMLTEALLT
jgi:hypothetical protein